MFERLPTLKDRDLASVLPHNWRAPVPVPVPSVVRVAGLRNIGRDEEAKFKKMAKHVLALTETQLAALFANGQFEEVVQDD